MSDLVKEWSEYFSDNCHLPAGAIRDLFDEIERLNKALDHQLNHACALDDEIERLRRNVDAMNCNRDHVYPLTLADHTKTIAELREHIAELEAALRWYRAPGSNWKQGYIEAQHNAARGVDLDAQEAWKALKEGE